MDREESPPKNYLIIVEMSMKRWRENQRDGE